MVAQAAQAAPGGKQIKGGNLRKKLKILNNKKIKNKKGY